MNKTRTAIIIMLVAILGSSTISAVSAMNGMVTKLENHFFMGDTQYANQSIYADVLDKADIASNLAKLAKEYLGDKESHIKDIIDIAKDIQLTKSISKLYDDMHALDTDVDWLIAELSNKNLTDTHKNLLTKYQSEYRSESRTIESDNYNTLVRQYYDETGGFPGFIFRGFAKKAEYFK